MSHLFQANLVRLLCSCGLLRPITAIYFCRHCQKLRCANCVSHEMDMLYCPSCLENMPSTEARLKKNRCGNCFDCPSCGQSLSTRASSIQSPDPEQPSRNVQRKLYYLACTGCRWTSRDVNIPDQTVATGGWPEQEPLQQQRILALLEHYRAVAQRDKLARERRRLVAARVKNTGSFLRSSEVSTAAGDKLSSMSPSIASVRKSLAAMSTYALKGDPPLNSNLEPSVASEEVEGLPDNIFTEPVVLSQVCSMSQRLSSPEHQPSSTSELYPLHKHMLVKRSLRCRHCEHNLSKPEYNTSSIKFKIQLAAYYHVPEIRMVGPVPLVAGQEACLQVSLCNPTPHMMPVALLPFLPQQHFDTMLADNRSKDGTGSVHASILSTGSGTTVGSTSLRDRLVIEVPQELGLPVTLCQAVRLPQGQLVLAGRDDTAEYDDTDAAQTYRDDPQVVAWRRANKVGVNIYVTPEEEEEEELHVGFVLRYDYTNTVIATNTGLSSISSGPMSLGPNIGSGLSLGSGPPSGPNSISGGGCGPSSLGPTAESRTVTLNVPVVIKVGRVTKDSTESHA